MSNWKGNYRSAVVSHQTPLAHGREAAIEWKTLLLRRMEVQVLNVDTELR
jgi:hypothetical protein